MLGGLLYELLTAGHVPFHFLLDNVPLLLARRKSAGPVRVTGVRGVGAEGLRGKTMVEAAAIDGVSIPWTVQPNTLPGSAGRLEEAKVLIDRCCKDVPSERLTLDELSGLLQDLQSREAAEEMAYGRAPLPPPRGCADRGASAPTGPAVDWADTFTCVQVRPCRWLSRSTRCSAPESHPRAQGEFRWIVPALALRWLTSWPSMGWRRASSTQWARESWRRTGTRRPCRKW
jgi:hypothetical protein